MRCLNLKTFHKQWLMAVILWWDAIGLRITESISLLTVLMFIPSLRPFSVCFRKQVVMWDFSSLYNISHIYSHGLDGVGAVYDVQAALGLECTTSCNNQLFTVSAACLSKCPLRSSVKSGENLCRYTYSDPCKAKHAHARVRAHTSPLPCCVQCPWDVLFLIPHYFTVWRLSQQWIEYQSLKSCMV